MELSSSFVYERAINPPKVSTPQTHRQDNNTTIALRVRLKQSPDAHSRGRAWSRGHLLSRSTKGHIARLTSTQVDPAGADFDALFAFSARRVLDLGNGV